MQRELVRTYAERFAVSDAVHPDDHIFNFLINHRGFVSDERRVRYYFRDGRESAEKLKGILARNLPKGKVKLFEFASGYGCVSRHLVGNKSIDHIACDIHPKAIEFLRSQIGAKAIQSASIPEEMRGRGTYDAVFALSFFSHMPITTWSRWLVRLYDHVRPGGILIFTTQGPRSVPHLQMEGPHAEFGYRFHLSSEQIDIPVEEYGQMVMTPDLVRKHIMTLANAEIIDDEVDTWWGHQDVFVVRKKAAKSSWRNLFSSRIAG